MSNINDQLRELLEEGEKRGFLSYDEILFALTDSALPEEEISKFYDTLQDKGITIVDDNSDDEDEGDDDRNLVVVPDIFAPDGEPPFFPDKMYVARLEIGLVRLAALRRRRRLAFIHRSGLLS